MRWKRAQLLVVLFLAVPITLHVGALHWRNQMFCRDPWWTINILSLNQQILLVEGTHPQHPSPTVEGCSVVYSTLYSGGHFLRNG